METNERTKCVATEVMIDTLRHILDIISERKTEEDEHDLYFRSMWNDQVVLKRVENFTRHRLKDLEKQYFASETEDDFNKYKELRIV